MPLTRKIYDGRTTSKRKMEFHHIPAESRLTKAPNLGSWLSAGISGIRRQLALTVRPLSGFKGKPARVKNVKVLSQSSEFELALTVRPLSGFKEKPARVKSVRLNQRNSLGEKFALRS
ncbi:hypothetical protein J6590_102523 [Homalodisca vitripennis]|nr:hypothetical protein J6590_102523 [Homalodisca vitripennis]